MGLCNSAQEAEVEDVVGLSCTNTDYKNKPVSEDSKLEYKIYFTQEQIRKLEESYRRIEKRANGDWGNSEQIEEFKSILGITSYKFAEKLFTVFTNIDHLKIRNNPKEIQDKINKLFANKENKEEEEEKNEKEKKEKEKNEEEKKEKEKKENKLFTKIKNEKLSFMNYVKGLTFVVKEEENKLSGKNDPTKEDVEEVVKNFGRKADFLFNFIDTDGGGTLSNEEITELNKLSLSNGGKIKIPKELFDQLNKETMEKIDEDGNGEIDFAEFLRAIAIVPNLLNCVQLNDPSITN